MPLPGQSAKIWILERSMKLNPVNFVQIPRGVHICTQCKKTVQNKSAKKLKITKSLRI